MSTAIKVVLHNILRVPDSGAVNGIRRIRHLPVPLLLLQLLAAAPAFPQNVPATVRAAEAQRDGGHDFDPLLGSWKYHLRRLQHPLSGSKEWVDLEGTGACYKVWDDRAQLDTIEVDGGGTHIEGLTLRLYNPASHQWRLYWANSRIGVLDPPQVGEFQNGRGDFYTQDTISGKTILIRYDWTHLVSNAPHFEQSFSDDGGTSWETNWITDQMRTGDAPAWNPQASAATPSAAHEPQHDFDFDEGTWKIHIRRLLHPLSGSSEWTEMDGTTVTRPIWDGRANLSTVDANGPTGHLDLLALRLYNPQARQWSIYFTTSDNGILSVPAIGEFHNGRGEFRDQETFHGRAILVRFSIWPTSPDSISAEQAFSDDGGKTWETNWVNTITRARTGEAQ